MIDLKKIKEHRNIRRAENALKHFNETLKKIEEGDISVYL